MGSDGSYTTEQQVQASSRLWGHYMVNPAYAPSNAGVSSETAYYDEPDDGVEVHVPTPIRKSRMSPFAAEFVPGRPFHPSNVGVSASAGTSPKVLSPPQTPHGSALSPANIAGDVHHFYQSACGSSSTPAFQNVHQVEPARSRVLASVPPNFVVPYKDGENFMICFEVQGVHPDAAQMYAWILGARVIPSWYFPSDRVLKYDRSEVVSVAAPPSM